MTPLTPHRSRLVTTALFWTVLLSRAFNVSAQMQRSEASIEQTIAGHYEGNATNSAKQVIPIALDLTASVGGVSGKITTTLGSFIVTGGSEHAGRLDLVFEGEGGKGSITTTQSASSFAGTFVLGGDSGSIAFTKTGTIAKSCKETQESLRTPIMFLGVYHMANPGLDAASFVADDVLTPQRQAQIKDLVTRLLEFKPTKVLVEAPYGDKIWSQRYQQYRAGQYTLGKNEIEQIGFRVAKLSGLHSLGEIDYLMFLSGLWPDELYLPDENRKSDSLIARPSIETSEEQLLHKSTVSAYLAHLNNPEALATGRAEYMGMLQPDSRPALYEKADLAANWYKRNLRIFENINRFTQPGDRVLVIIGAGHVSLLEEFASDSAYFRVVSPVLLLTRPLQSLLGDRSDKPYAKSRMLR